MVGKSLPVSFKVESCTVMPHLQGFTLPEDEHHLVFILVNLDREEMGCRFKVGLLYHLSPSWL